MVKLAASPETVHWGYFDRDQSPALRIQPGDTVELETFSYPREMDCPDLVTPRLQRILNEVHDMGPGRHLLTGPIHVAGAAPGDVLAVHIESVEPLLPFGFNRMRDGAEGLGLLPEDFPEGRFTLLPLDVDSRTVRVAAGVDVPMRVFFGIMGVASAVEGRVSSRAPGDFGGNMDITELTGGTTLYLPVFVDGALFSVGDGHAAQGDGEVNLTAAETSLVGRLRFELVKSSSLRRPMAETPTHVITVGFHEDLEEAARSATREMIQWITRTHGLSAAEAYVLCSLAVDLRVSQLVNGTKGIHAMLPKAVFTGTDAGAKPVA